MSDRLLSLEEAATELRVRPTTIMYWLRALPDVPFSSSVRTIPPRFRADDLGLLRTIRALALDAGYPARRIAETIGAWPSPPSKDTIPMDKLAQEMQMLREEIAFLAEESKELHRMLALLLQLTWRNGTRQDLEVEPTESKVASPTVPAGPLGTAMATVNSPQKKGEDGARARWQTKPWAPPDLS